MSSFSQTLRNWRKSRRFSQLELALEADVSVRHVAFLETGKAMPSPAMIDKLGNALDLPLAARNQMLTQAGFAPRFCRPTDGCGGDAAGAGGRHADAGAPTRPIRPSRWTGSGQWSA